MMPLAGLRVVDFTWVLAGPMATKALALMGAEVIKIESTTRPEYSRRGGTGPLVNNNKKSCTINIKSEEGQKLVRQLVAKSNIVVENFSAEVLDRLGLDYDSLKKVKSDLIYVSSSGLGRTGPHRDALAYGTLLQAFSGRATMVGNFNSRLEGMGLTGWVDPIVAQWEMLAILAAVDNWRRKGVGARIDVSMLECTVSLLPEALIGEALGIPNTPTRGFRDVDAAPSGCFRCIGEDNWIMVSVLDDDHWRGLCAALERPDLASHRSYGDAGLRLADKAVLDGIVAAWARHRDAAEAEATLVAHSVPASRTLNIDEAIATPSSQQRDLFPLLPDGTRTFGQAWREADGWRPKLTPPPDLGGDNAYVFGDLLGLPGAEIERLTASGVIQ